MPGSGADAARDNNDDDKRPNGNNEYGRECVVPEHLLKLAVGVPDDLRAYFAVAVKQQSVRRGH